MIHKFNSIRNPGTITMRGFANDICRSCRYYSADEKTCNTDNRTGVIVMNYIANGRINDATECFNNKLFYK